MYKSITGWQIIKDDKHEATHILLTNDEYNELIRQNRAQNTISTKKENDFEAEKEAIFNEAVNQVNAIKAEAQEIIDELTADRDRYKENYAKEFDLNKNLRLVAKERENKARKIPKKGNAYIIIDKQRKGLTIKTKDEEYKKDVYYTKILTPWDCSLSEDKVDRLVLHDISNGDLHIGDKYNYTKDNPTKISIDMLKDTQKAILQRIYRANARDGFWELTIVTNFETEIDPKHRTSRYA